MTGWKVLYWFCSLLTLFFCFSQALAQMLGNYSKGRIFLKNGSIIEGKNLTMTPNLA